MTVYNAAEINEKLKDLNGWSAAENTITKTFIFKNFSAAFAFMTRVAMIAEKMDHHPDWSNVYNKVTLKLSTHDAGGITEKDLKFAGKVEELMMDNG